MPRVPGETAYPFGDDLTPNFQLEVVGQGPTQPSRLFESIRPLVQGVVVEHDEQMSSRLEVMVHVHPDSPIGQPVNWQAVLDNKAIAEGNVFELWMGRGAKREFMGRFEITRWLPNLGATGPEPIVLKAYDGRHKMQLSNKEKVKGTRKIRKHVYKNLTDEDIVAQIADKYGYGSDVDATEDRRRTETITVGGKTTTTKVLTPRLQDVSTSDWEFLQKLARIHRYDLWVDWSLKNHQWVVHFKQTQDAGQALFHFQYGPNGDGSLISAQPTFSLTEQVTDVEVTHYDRKTRDITRTVVAETNPAEDVSVSGSVGRSLVARQEMSSGASVRFRAFDQTIEAFSDRPFASKREAQDFVRRWLLEREREFLILEGKVYGIPELKARQIHLLTGMSKRMDGYYRFTNVTHPMGKGSETYECEFKAHKILSQDVVRRPITTKAKGK